MREQLGCIFVSVEARMKNSKERLARDWSIEDWMKIQRGVPNFHRLQDNGSSVLYHMLREEANSI